MDNAQYQHQSSNVLGKFRLIAELGRGGMSEVYLAVVAGPAGFNKLVVVKLIKAELAEDPEFISMFLEEARLSARLNHPNIVQTNEVGQHNGRYFIAMEYLEGQPFSRIISRLGRDRGLPLGMGMRILSDVLSGLHYAHELRDFDGSPLGVVHRDVTPHNVFVTYDGQVKVVDFGIAKAMNSANETRTGMLKGKVGYIAPEQARGERVDRRADIFSVGVMLWEVATGRRMWKGFTEVQVLHQLMSGDLPRPRSVRPDISEQLEGIIMRALSMNREDRHASCLELQADLEELMDGANERTTLRDVGRRVQNAFEDERQKLGQIIEGQLARSAQLPTGMYQQVELPNLEQQRMTGENPMFRPSFGPSGEALSTGSIPRLGGTGSNPSHASQPSWAQSGGYGHVSQGHGSGPHPEIAHAHHPTSGAFPSARSGAPGPHASYVGPLPSVSSMVPQPASYSNPHTPHSHSGHTGSIAHASVSAANLRRAEAQSAQTGRLTLVALALAAAAAGLVALLYFSVGRGNGADAAHASPQPSAPAATSASLAASAPGAASAAPSTSASASPSASSLAAPSTMTLKVVVKPKDAKVFLDDKKLEKNPVEVPKDGQVHQLRVEALGYTTRSRDFTASDDLTWDLELSPEPRGARPVVTKKDGSAKDPPKDDDGKMQSGHTVRPVDTSYTP